MSSGDTRPDPAPDEEAGTGLGDKIHADRKQRIVHPNGGDNSLDVNLTKMGVNVHGIEKGDLVEVEVREHGIAIKPLDFEVTHE